MKIIRRKYSSPSLLTFLSRHCTGLFLKYSLFYLPGADTGIKQDDYFSTLGKAFVGLRLMLEAYPTKKWFVVLGDDNYVHVDNYVNALSAFDPDMPWALSHMVNRKKFGCKVTQQRPKLVFEKRLP